MLKYPVLIVAGVSLAVPAVAQTTVQPQPLPAQTAQSDVNKLICKREEEIGSRLASKKICLTQQQWRERADDARDQVQRVQQQASTRPSG